MSDVSEASIKQALREVIEPELHRDLISLNMVRDIKISGGNISLTVLLVPLSRSFKNQIETDVTDALKKLPGVENITLQFDDNVPADPRLIGNMDIGVRNAIAVASGKGGVGKSTLAANLALSLALDGNRVGLLDADIYGPNIPMMMGVSDRPQGNPQTQKIEPPIGHGGIKIMSMGFLLDPNQAVIWRGPMVHNALRQFLQDADWGNVDYLIIDLPPGTGDASLSLAQSLSMTGAVIVTTPQKVALSDVVRGVKMFEQLNVPIFGVIENMSYFVAPDTGNRYDIFGHGGGADMAKEVGVDFLGEVPLEPNVRAGGDEGQPIVISEAESPAAQSIRAIARKIAAITVTRNLRQQAGQIQDQPTLNIIN